jgi:hypothetical protein
LVCHCSRHLGPQWHFVRLHADAGDSFCEQIFRSRFGPADFVLVHVDAEQASSVDRRRCGPRPFADLIARLSSSSAVSKLRRPLLPADPLMTIRKRRGPQPRRFAVPTCVGWNLQCPERNGQGAEGP